MTYHGQTLDMNMMPWFRITRRAVMTFYISSRPAARQQDKHCLVDE